MRAWPTASKMLTPIGRSAPEGGSAVVQTGYTTFHAHSRTRSDTVTECPMRRCPTQTPAVPRQSHSSAR